MKRLAALALAGALAASPLAAVPVAAWAQAKLLNPAQEARAHALFRQVRCVVCQNESIDDSEAELAGDLRAIVRRQVAQGRTDAQIRSYLVDRYGEFVLLKPRFSPGNALLWLAPFVIVGGGALVLARRRRRVELEPELSDEERAALAAALGPGVTVPPQSRPTADARPV